VEYLSTKQPKPISHFSEAARFQLKSISAAPSAETQIAQQI